MCDSAHILKTTHHPKALFYCYVVRVNTFQMIKWRASKLIEKAYIILNLQRASLRKQMHLPCMKSLIDLWC